MPSMKEQALIFYDIITTFLCAHFARINVISFFIFKNNRKFFAYYVDLNFSKLTISKDKSFKVIVTKILIQGLKTI